MSSNVRATLLAIIMAVSSIGLVTMPDQASAAPRKVPQGFFGVDMDPWQLSRLGSTVDAEMAAAAASGVESVRIPLYWFDIQPYATWSDIPWALRGRYTASPDGGAPYNWAAADAFMTAASRTGIRVLPIVLGAPRWAADPSSNRAIPVPTSPSRYAEFCAAAVARYGTRGSFWAAHPELTANPVTAWQIWNEPDLDRFWPQHSGETQSVTVNGQTKRLKGLGFAPSYVALLKAARTRIKATDSNAKVMLASMTNLAWFSLKLVYASGARGSFDEVGANVFSKTAPNIVSAVKTIRATMAANHDSSLPYSVTEYSWASGTGSIDPTSHMGWLVSSQADQAKKAGLAIDQFLASRVSLKLKATYWYTWGSSDSGVASVWDYAGLRRLRPGANLSKPVLATFAKKALAAEGCRTKTVATACAS